MGKKPSPDRKAEAAPRARRKSARSGGVGVTLKSVAEMAGVAPATVSRAINRPDLVAADTRERINRVIEQTGYLPNLLAGGLASSRSRLFAAIVPSIANLVYAETIQSFTRRIREKGYQVLLGEASYDENAEENVVSAVLGRRPDGVVLLGINHTIGCRRKLLAAKIPVAEIWDITPTPLDTVVGYSHEKIGTAVADYLYDRGYRNFAAIAGEDVRAVKRTHAFENRLARRGVSPVMTGFVPPGSSLQFGRRRLAVLLDQGFRNGAVFCSSDTLALGVLTEAHARGLSVPGEIAVVGFCDQDFAAFTHPALTSVKVDRALMGSLAADALLARTEGIPFEGNVVDIGFTIVTRETA